jgi:hypothetical protein
VFCNLDYFANVHEKKLRRPTKTSNAVFAVELVFAEVFFSIPSNSMELKPEICQTLPRKLLQHQNFADGVKHRKFNQISQSKAFYKTNLKPPLVTTQLHLSFGLSAMKTKADLMWDEFILKLRGQALPVLSANEQVIQMPTP